MTSSQTPSSLEKRLQDLERQVAELKRRFDDELRRSERRRKALQAAIDDHQRALVVVFRSAKVTGAPLNPDKRHVIP